MKVRVKFSKNGIARFLGHLDTMRYFQKAVRRAGIPAAFSGGFCPHMLMSFASPLGLGMSSDGEYFDMELSGGPEGLVGQELAGRLNKVMAEGFHVASVRQVPEGRKHNAMALAAAADYKVRIPCKWEGQVEGFYGQPSILAEKKAKAGRKMVDLKPGIYRMQAEEGVCSLRLAASSANFVNPKLLLDAFAAYLGEDPGDWCYGIHKLEVYANKGTDTAPRFVPLEELGEEFG